jgi:ferric-dicitrate binding protein FerR (iron transport regulator)
MNYDILQRHIEGNSNQQEKEDIAQWLDADEKNMQEFLLLKNIYDITLWSDDGASLRTEKDGSSEEKLPARRKSLRIIQELIKVAAVFLLAWGSYHLFMLPETTACTSSLQTVYAPEGQRSEITLSDGTKVWLNAKSSIVFPDQFAETNRMVELDGEAYFDVSHDPDRKFIVKTKMFQIKVHGTEFNVNAYAASNNFETSLVKGSIEIVSNSTNESILLQPDNKVYLKDNKLILAKMQTQDQFLWKRGILSFENQNFRDLIEKFELYYGVQIEIRNDKMLIYQYTGKLWINDGIDHALRVLQLRQNFRYTKDNMNNIIIY